MKRILLFVSAIIVATITMAATYSVKDIPNVHIQDRTQFISDPDGYMSEEARLKANRILRTLMDSTSVETAVVLVESIGQIDIELFSQQLFDEWKIGKDDKDNGLLLIFVMDQRKARIHTGYGMEGVIPDITAKNIINLDIIPNMKHGDIDNAIVTATEHIYQICSDPENIDEIWSDQKNSIHKTSDSSELHTILILIALLAFVFALAMFFNNVSKLKGKTNYQKSEIMRNGLWVLAVMSILSALSAAIFFVLALILSKYFRNKPIRCDNCNTKMTKVSEEEDNQYLTPSQDREEQLKSVDYDVWLCPKCGETEVFPFKSKATMYQQCPLCHTYASSHIYDRVHRKPTVSVAGQGMHVYECKYCHRRHEAPYEIPKIVPVVPIGGGGHGVGGGGISGGSFGGGMSGGGGASGGW